MQKDVDYVSARQRGTYSAAKEEHLGLGLAAVLGPIAAGTEKKQPKSEEGARGLHGRKLVVQKITVKVGGVAGRGRTVSEAATERSI